MTSRNPLNGRSVFEMTVCQKRDVGRQEWESSQFTTQDRLREMLSTGSPGQHTVRLQAHFKDAAR